MNPENEKTEEELKWEEFVKKETAQNSEWTKQYEKEQLKVWRRFSYCNFK